MSILVDRATRVVVQGITGRDGSFHAKQMLEYGTKIVAGVTPGKGGQKFENTVPIFNTVADAIAATNANTSVIYVPPMFAAVLQPGDVFHHRMAGGGGWGNPHERDPAARERDRLNEKVTG